jgi:MOSC domain-containing protein YiiM
VAVRTGKVLAISTSSRRGVPKTNVEQARLIADRGIEGDAHAGFGHRQVSLLAIESIDTIRAKGLAVNPGAFAENITTEGIVLTELRIGDRLLVGACELEVTQIGKECHARCEIYRQAGDCVMPREGIFAKVIAGGAIYVGDVIRGCDHDRAGRPGSDGE